MSDSLDAVNTLTAALLEALEAGDTERASDWSQQRDHAIRALVPSLDDAQRRTLQQSDDALQAAVIKVRERVIVDLEKLRTGRSAVAAYGSVSAQN
ncbi:MAG: hypothetical protein AAF270_16895 [Pseudomonadota bacterium]